MYLAFNIHSVPWSSYVPWSFSKENVEEGVRYDNCSDNSSVYYLKDEEEGAGLTIKPQHVQNI